MQVLVAMSGGVDSSSAAALLLEQGHEVVGVTMKLWGGASDTGCCSVADVEDARRVAQQLGIDHVVFNFTDDFDRHVVEPYVHAHTIGLTPNPCIECNRHLKFDRLFERADQLGFDAVATGHHCRVVEVGGARFVARGADAAKDQSYVVHMLDQAALARTMFPVGTMTKAEVRAHAVRCGLRTAAKSDSQDVCFITSDGGREAFLGTRIPMRSGRLIDLDGRDVGSVDAIEMVTIGQRRGLDLGGSEGRRYAVAVDPVAGVVTVGSLSDLQVDHMDLSDIAWVSNGVDTVLVHAVLVQTSAHGPVAAATIVGERLEWAEPHRRIAPGQSVVFYDRSNERVLGSANAR